MTDATPQFGTAEYKSSPGADTCKNCKQTLTGRYYRINGALACEQCTEKLKTQLPKDSHAAFVRGLVFGIGGAILGLILYSVFGIVTGIVIGYVSLAVGFIVGKAIRFGSGGIGGRRYQIAAALLTYAAVSMAAIPMSISQAIKEKKTGPPARIEQSPSGSPSKDASQPDGAASSTSPQSAHKPQMNLGAALIGLALVGLASPFLELQNPFHGIIGLVILFVGIRIAWQLTAGPKIDILGPFVVGASVPPPITT
ncbi:MAG TPA: hypothetical protein VEI73_04055 [Candidatus Acidoferrum sp.]|nr:hypothetical protein [Candidatus Acidoferrum sp.]